MMAVNSKCSSYVLKNFLSSAALKENSSKNSMFWYPTMRTLARVCVAHRRARDRREVRLGTVSK
jgi:hypothetical protein